MSLIVKQQNRNARALRNYGVAACKRKKSRITRPIFDSKTMEPKKMISIAHASDHCSQLIPSPKFDPKKFIMVRASNQSLIRGFREVSAETKRASVSPKFWDLQRTHILNQDAWVILMNRIQSFQKLPTDWNGYGADAISSVVVSISKIVSNELEKRGFIPKNADPTGDGSIVISAFKDSLQIECEIMSSTNFGLAKFNTSGDSFYDASNLEELLTLID